MKMLTTGLGRSLREKKKRRKVRGEQEGKRRREEHMFACFYPDIGDPDRSQSRCTCLFYIADKCENDISIDSLC